MASVDEKNKKIDDNIGRLDEAVSNALEKRMYHIEEKMANTSIFQGKEERHSFEKVFGTKKRKYYCIDENKKYIESVQNSIALCDTLLYADIYGEKRKDVFSNSKNNNPAVSTVVYLRNPLTDIAYSNFSKVLKDARVSYEESFIAVCEAVYYNRVPYCILPIENYEDGRLSGFMNIIRKYELKIVMTCNVESASGKITKFALLKRELTRIEYGDILKDGFFLEIGFSFGEEQSRLHEVISAALFFGYKLNKIDSLPIYYSEKEYYFDVVFLGDGDLMKFLCWLDFEFPRYEVLGIYTQIKTM